MGEKTFKEKVLEVIDGIYHGVENALRSVVSKRMYVIALVTYLAIAEMDWKKFLGLCAVACVYIWSETKKKG